MRNLIIWDLDETVINSTHRTPNNPDGTLNLARYLELQTRENIYKDTLLPAITIMRQRYAMGDYILIVTARGMSPADYDFLRDMNIPHHKILSRNDIPQSHYRLSDGKYKLRHIKRLLNLRQFANMPVLMLDDAKPVKNELRKLFPVLCAHKINRRLAKGK